MRSNFLGEFFGSASRYILFVPVIILLAGVVIKLDSVKKNNDVTLQKVSSPQGTEKEKDPQKLPTAIPTLFIAFNPTKSFACLTSEKEATVEAYRRDTEIYIQVDKDKKDYFFLIHKDCFYQWEKQASGGSMFCGVNQYVNIFDSMYMSGNVNINSLIDTFQDKNTHLSMQEIQTIINSCRNSTTIPEKVFKIPSNIKFTEEKI